MAFTLIFSGYATYYAYAQYVVYCKTLVDAEWTDVGENDAGLKAIPFVQSPPHHLSKAVSHRRNGKTHLWMRNSRPFGIRVQKGGI